MRRPVLPLATAVAFCTAITTATAVGAAAGGHTAAAGHAALHRAAGAQQRVIVLLRDQSGAVAALHAGRAGLAAQQAPVTAAIHALGGSTSRTFTAVNAVAASVPQGGLAALRADPAVLAVVPDLPRSLPRQASETATRAAAAAPATSMARPPAGACPTGSKPQLEPEALQLTHTDSDTPGAKTARSLGYTGKGVAVAFIADGLDVDQPDFIRANGQHVITDYQDFSGDGIAAPTSGAEAFGDASGIAAQGRKAYDLSTYVSTAHPLPAGCDIRIEGMAPGASIVALKVFSNELLTAPTSTIIQAIDYAVNVDHVDVINESFGSNPYPDNATDPISLANKNAVDAGITVVASTGDAGISNSLGTAATDPYVIGAGASTMERSYAQQRLYAFQLSNHHYTSNQVSALSSGGISQTNRVQDLLAPGDLGWALCSAKLDSSGNQLFPGCTDDNFAPSNIQDFGGTSQSAPLTSGAAALVIQAYRAGHGGSSPTPAQVRQALDSSADDLGLPTSEQGAGLLDTYRAVLLAYNMGGTGTGGGLVLSRTQASSAAMAGSHVTTKVSVTNSSSRTQHVTAATRKITTVIGQQTQRLSLSAASPTATFVDGFGITRSYVTTTFSVPVGVDRLDATLSVIGTAVGSPARVTLLDPRGTYTAYSLPQGAGDFGQVDVHQPVAGRWTAIIWCGASASGYNGPVTLRTKFFRATSAGSVSPPAFALLPGRSQQVTVTTTAPSQEATADSLVLTSGAGVTTMPIVTRAIEPVSATSPVTISGTFHGGNGRDFGPAQTYTYLLSVPAGARDLDVSVDTGGTPPNLVVAHLSDPQGEPTSTALNGHPTDDGIVTDTGLQIVHAQPIAGTWQLTLELVNPVQGAPLPQAFHGLVTLNGAHVVARGVPNGGTVRSGRSPGGTVTIYNTSTQPQTYFLDPRSTHLTTYRLVAVPPATAPNDPYTAKITAPLQSDDVLPEWLVPTEVSRLTVTSQASAKVAVDVMPLDTPTAINSPNNPDIEATVSGKTATAVLAAHEIGSALWAAFPTPFGPDPVGGSPTVTVKLVATGLMKAFQGDVTSDTGDQLLGTVQSGARAAAPVTIPPGGHATVQVHLDPAGGPGTTESGVIYVDTISPFGAAGVSTLGDEVAAIPFSFTVGG